MLRRWLLFVMAFVLPVQFAFAAAANYCQHESTGIAKHFGHHEHKHPVSGASKTSDLGSVGDSQGKSGLGDPDCEFCHLSGSATLVTPAPVFGVLPPRDAFSADDRAGYRSHVPYGPERPDRSEDRLAARFGGGVAFGPTFD